MTKVRLQVQPWQIDGMWGPLGSGFDRDYQAEVRRQMNPDDMQGFHYDFGGSVRIGAVIAAVSYVSRDDQSLNGRVPVERLAELAEIMREAEKANPVAEETS